MCLASGLRARAHWGSFSAPPGPLAAIGEGPICKGKGGKGKELPPLSLTSGFGPDDDDTISVDEAAGYK